MVDEQYDLPTRTQSERLIERDEEALVLHVEDGVVTSPCTPAS